MRKNRANLIFASLLYIGLFLCGTCLAEESLPFQGEVVFANANVRSDSTAGSEIICALNKGDRVEVMQELYGWYKIRLPKNSPAYIKRSFLECISFKETGNECASARLSRDRVNIRLHPNTSSAILGAIDRNEVVSVIEDRGDWYRIEPVANSFGWVNTRFVKKTSSVITTAAVQDNITVIGVITPYGRFFKRTATHKLISADNKVFLLKGNKLNMDALCNKKVRVIGKVISAPGQEYPLIEVRILEVAN